MKCLTKSWLRPSKRSASVNLPSGASKTYCLSTFTQGSARRSAASRSRDRVSSFSFTKSALRASSHSVRVTICGLFMTFSSSFPSLPGRTSRLRIDIRSVAGPRSIPVASRRIIRMTRLPMMRVAVAVILMLALATGASGSPAQPWPPVLGSRESYPPDVSAAVERVWSDPTLSRTVKGRAAHVPLDVYVAFLDTPDVTAAAAGFRGLASYEIQALDDSRYLASDGVSARGARSEERRVGKE